MRRKSFVAAMLSIAVALPAAAGTGFVVESQKLDENEPPGRSEVKRDGPRMRVDLEGGRHTILQLRDEGRLLALDHKRKTYLELDQSMVETAARIGRVGRELQERTGMLPEGSQAATEELLAGALGDLGELPTYTLRPTDEAGRVGEVACRETELLNEGVLEARICEASADDAAIAAGAMEGVRELAALARDVLPLVPGASRDAGLEALDLFDQVEGVPLRVRTYRDGNAVLEATVVDAKEMDVPASTFAVPDGYASMINITVREAIGGP
jgi:hypothetical protein